MFKDLPYGKHTVSMGLAGVNERERARVVVVCVCVLM